MAVWQYDSMVHMAVWQYGSVSSRHGFCNSNAGAGCYKYVILPDFSSDFQNSSANVIINTFSERALQVPQQPTQEGRRSACPTKENGIRSDPAEDHWNPLRLQ